MTKEKLAALARQRLQSSTIVGEPTVEIIEESDDLKMIRNIMEEDQDEFELKVTMQLAEPIEYLTFEFVVPPEED